MTSLEELTKAFADNGGIRGQLRLIFGSPEFKMAKRWVEAKALDDIHKTPPEQNPVIATHRHYVTKGIMECLKMLDFIASEKPVHEPDPPAWEYAGQEHQQQDTQQT